ncbi:hypothetical protein QJS66_08310 [Kocuria rhizophila]|nr:hypothetical protein QJS66_08310 [Kocuria rhizophila]
MRYRGRTITTQSIVMRSHSGTVRMVEAEHLATKWEEARAPPGLSLHIPHQRAHPSSGWARVVGAGR